MSRVLCQLPSWYSMGRQNVNTTFIQKKYFSSAFFFHARWFLCTLIWSKSFPSFECETFFHVLHGKQHDKQVQGGSVLIIEPGTLLCLPKTKKRCCVKF